MPTPRQLLAAYLRSRRRFAQTSPRFEQRLRHAWLDMLAAGFDLEDWVREHQEEIETCRHIVKIGANNELRVRSLTYDRADSRSKARHAA